VSWLVRVTRRISARASGETVISVTASIPPSRRRKVTLSAEKIAS